MLNVYQSFNSTITLNVSNNSNLDINRRHLGANILVLLTRVVKRSSGSSSSAFKFGLATSSSKVRQAQ